ncbi:Putative membrane protein YdgH [Corynebacterium ciconiae DSM 44920]|uniref:MMPL family transporter n=1 Tax=Corynebacterium ciconiae TaxID=227319 RepID=UPI00037B135E|nr:MMPL family transporter [Corynebacterium ciconiae]WKD61925.1 Putative membrane protein YdgH [Corynebacterium ciconiae DSM 44920]
MTTSAPSRWYRLGLPLLLIAVWVVVMGLGGPQFGAISEVSSNDQASFLPESAESTTVSEALPEFRGSDSIPAVVVITGDAISPTELSDLTEQLGSSFPNLEFSPLIPSEDGEALQLVAAIPSDADVADTVSRLDTALSERLPDGDEFWVTGPAGLSADLSAAFAGIDSQLLLVTVAAVLLVLIVVYRSPILPLMVLLSALTALCLAVAINVALARAGVVTINGQVQGILFILVIGAATDYGLLYTARYREELSTHEQPWQATRAALSGTWEPIAASAGTVIAGLLCLVLSDLVSTAALGPVASLGILAAVATSLTFLPAMLLLAGRAAFWPRRPRTSDGQTSSATWTRVADATARRPRALALGISAALACGWLGLIGFQADGVPQSDFVLGQSDARDGLEVLDRHFPGGSGSPVYVLSDEADLDSTLSIIDATAGVEQPSALPARAAEPTVIDGQVMIQATLDDPADSDAAKDTVRRLREALPSAAVGGTTAVDMDTTATSLRDRNIIIPLVLAVITVMLAGLLRSVLAPVVLLATTILSFGTALGLSALIFHLIGFSGADPTVPLYGFVFLVALGIDYNIFLMTRVREEALLHGTYRGVRRGLITTGGVITSAGVVLAATFAALAVIPIQFLVQLAVIVALGVLIDALIVRSFLVPALSLWLGNRIWWPAHSKYPHT